MPTRSSISFHTCGILRSACNQGVTSTTSGRTCRVAHEEMKMSQRASMTDESPTSSLPRKITPCFVALTSSLTFRSRPPLSSPSWRRTDGLTRSHDLGRRRKCRRPPPPPTLIKMDMAPTAQSPPGERVKYPPSRLSLPSTAKQLKIHPG